MSERRAADEPRVKRTAHMLADSTVMNYIGYVEGDQIYSGDIDLVVCDGFVGNIALKASEGLAKLMIDTLKDSYKRNWFNKLAGIMSKPALSYFKKRMDPSRYNGASLLGLNGIVIKSHGGAGIDAFSYAVEEAVLQVNTKSADLVRDQISELINQGLLL